MLQSPFLKNIKLKSDDQNKDTYPFCLDIFRDGFDLSISKPILILSGDNGTGKSTLLEAIAHHIGFNVSGGNRNHVYDQNVDVAPLSSLMKFSWLPKVNSGFFMRAESFINFAGYLDNLAKDSGKSALKPYGGTSLNNMSHGEAFLSLFDNKFGNKGVYLLDEPEAALSPMKQMELIRTIYELEKSNNAQVIMVTHSPILMSYPNAQFLYIKDGHLRSDLNYRDTDHYKITRRYLERPELYLEEILKN